MWGYFLGTHCLNPIAYLTAVADHFLPFVTTSAIHLLKVVLPSGIKVYLKVSGGCMLLNNELCCKL